MSLEPLSRETVLRHRNSEFPRGVVLTRASGTGPCFSQAADEFSVPDDPTRG